MRGGRRERERERERERPTCVLVFADERICVPNAGADTTIRRAGRVRAAPTVVEPRVMGASFTAAAGVGAGLLALSFRRTIRPVRPSRVDLAADGGAYLACRLKREGRISAIYIRCAGDNKGHAP